VTFKDRNGYPHRDFDSGDPNDSNNSPYLISGTEANGTPIYTGSTPDQITVPAITGTADPNNVANWKQTTAGTPWDIYQESAWQSAGFFGGSARLSLEILSGTNVVSPREDYNFRIAGENPSATTCRYYIESQFGTQAVPARSGTNPNAWQGYWFAAAVAKEETNGVGSSHFYNQFTDNGGQTSIANPGHEGAPAWHNDGTNGDRPTGTGGYGLFQLTYDMTDASYIEPRSWIWNWQANVTGVMPEFEEKLGNAQTLYGKLTNYDSATIPNHDQFNGLEAIMLTDYNGMWGPQIRIIRINGVRTKTCWVPSGRTWAFLPNHQNYVDEVNSHAP
jgi:hypothetical protein